MTLARSSRLLDVEARIALGAKFGHAGGLGRRLVVPLGALRDLDQHPIEVAAANQAAARRAFGRFVQLDLGAAVGAEPFDQARPVGCRHAVAAQKGPVLDELVALGAVAQTLAGIERYAVVVGLGPNAHGQQIEDRVAGDLHQPHLGHFDPIDLVAIVEIALLGNLQREPLKNPVRDERPHRRQVLGAPGLLQFEKRSLGPPGRKSRVSSKAAITGVQLLELAAAASARSARPSGRPRGE